MQHLFALVTTDLNYDQRMQRSCDALQSDGFNVTLIGRVLKNSTPLNSNRIYKQQRLNCWFLKGPLFYLEFQFRLIWELLFRKVDLVLAVDLDTLPAAVLLGWLKGVPVVYDAHEYYTETPELVRRRWIQKIWEFIAAFCIPKTAAAYTVSFGLAGLLSDRYKRPFSTVRNVPFRRHFFKKEGPPARKVILYQGALNEGRGLEVLLESVSALPAVIEVQLAGEGDLSKQLRMQAKALGIEKRVRFLGWIEPEHLNNITAEAWIGYNLLEDRGLSYHYSLANKTFDYIQAGVPALHSNLPEYRHLLEKYPVGIIVNTLSTEEVIRVLTKLMHAPDEWRAMHFQCELAAKDLIWENESAQLIHNIKAVLSANP
jgi:glycosyltransferase involved in cell wall biosynthesis